MSSYLAAEFADVDGVVVSLTAGGFVRRVRVLPGLSVGGGGGGHMASGTG